MHALHDLAVDAARIDAQLFPELQPLGRSPPRELDWAFLLAKFRKNGRCQRNRAVHAVFLHQAFQLGRIFNAVGWCFALHYKLEGPGYIPSMVGVGCCSCGDASQEVTGNYDIRSGSADTFGGTFSKGIDATGAHVAVATA